MGTLNLWNQMFFSDIRFQYMADMIGQHSDVHVVAFQEVRYITNPYTRKPKKPHAPSLSGVCCVFTHQCIHASL